MLSWWSIVTHRATGAIGSPLDVGDDIDMGDVGVNVMTLIGRASMCSAFAGDLYCTAWSRTSAQYWAQGWAVVLDQAVQYRTPANTRHMLACKKPGCFSGGLCLVVSAGTAVIILAVQSHPVTVNVREGSHNLQPHAPASFWNGEVNNVQVYFQQDCCVLSQDSMQLLRERSSLNKLYLRSPGPHVLPLI